MCRSGTVADIACLRILINLVLLSVDVVFPARCGRVLRLVRLLMRCGHGLGKVHLHCSSHGQARKWTQPIPTLNRMFLATSGAVADGEARVVGERLVSALWVSHVVEVQRCIDRVQSAACLYRIAVHRSSTGKNGIFEMKLKFAIFRLRGRATCTLRTISRKDLRQNIASARYSASLRRRCGRPLGVGRDARLDKKAWKFVYFNGMPFVMKLNKTISVAYRPLRRRPSLALHLFSTSILFTDSLRL